MSIHSKTIFAEVDWIKLDHPRTNSFTPGREGTMDCKLIFNYHPLYLGKWGEGAGNTNEFFEKIDTSSIVSSLYPCQYMQLGRWALLPPPPRPLRPVETSSTINFDIKGNFVYHHWGCTLIYRALYYPSVQWHHYFS